jgi:hypothetical protein
MCADRIMISPSRYDDVQKVLQRLGSQYANGRQLNGQQMLRLGDPSFLSGTELLFLNCGAEGLSQVAADPKVCHQLRAWVENGGTLYASDWACDVVAASFGDRVKFGGKVGKAETLAARVSDPDLARQLNYSVSLTFNLGGWVRITQYPADAEVYLTDAQYSGPLAIGVIVGKGRVVFTSFHHHAQPSGSDEDKLLAWLITLPGQHRLLLTSASTHKRRRAPVRNQVVGSAGAGKQRIPLRMGPGKGLGVFSLAWEPEDGVRFGMRYLRGNEVSATARPTARPPLIMTVRNPRPQDSVEVSRAGENGTVADTPRPFVFAAGLREDLLDNPDWLASSVLRHLTGILGSHASPGMAREVLTHGRVIAIVDAILSGLGYRSQHSAESVRDENQAEVLAWAPDDTDAPPALRIGVTAADRTDVPRQWRPSYQMCGEPDPATEYLLVSVSLAAGRTDFEWSDRVDDAPMSANVHSSSESMQWLPVSSATGTLGYEHEIISNDEFQRNYHFDVAVYRAEPTPRPEDHGEWKD